MMAELLYKIADIINANSKVYRAVVPEARHDYMMHENGKLVKSSCLVLRIMLSGKVKHSMFLHKKNLKFFCCSFEKNVLLRMCIQQQMRMFSMSH